VRRLSVGTDLILVARNVVMVSRVVVSCFEPKALGGSQPLSVRSGNNVLMWRRSGT